MKEKGFIALASIIISIIYLIPEYPVEPAIAILSYIPFLAGVLYCLRNEDCLWFIIFGEILVINNHLILSSFLIQVVIITVFYTLYVSKGIHAYLPIISAIIAITALFAFLETRIQIRLYTVICIAALLIIYILLEINWRRIQRKVPEES